MIGYPTCESPGGEADFDSNLISNHSDKPTSRVIKNRRAASAWGASRRKRRETKREKLRGRKGNSNRTRSTTGGKTGGVTWSETRSISGHVALQASA